MPEHSQNLPPVNDDDLGVRVGTSLLEEFAVGHSAADVIRELVQNEYDAGGARLEVDFGEDALEVRGYGAPVDANGWQRLSVMLGTGNVAGQNSIVRAKVNGIGSKNFGLRSLFLFGDRIYVESAGRYTYLDARRGSFAKPKPVEQAVPDPQASVRVVVEYRRAQEGRLPPFGVDQEANALADIAAVLAPTLVKLALPDAPKSLRKVVVSSQRLGRELSWRQSVRPVRGRNAALQRRIRIEQTGTPAARVPEAISEIEYRRVVKPPSDLRVANVPAYFTVRGGRVRLGVSFPTRARTSHLDRQAAGAFYYPLGAMRARTGFPFSINAPFEMNEDRSQLIAVGISRWNEWLIQQAAKFVIDLLPDDLFDTFGADGYAALDPDSETSATVPELPALIRHLLRTEKCWPTQRTSGTRRAATFAAADALSVPTSPALATFVADSRPGIAEDRVLHAQLVSSSDASRLAVVCGAKRFTLNSLIRLRCSTTDSAALQTKLDTDEANWSYPSPEGLANLGRQDVFASTLDAEARNLRDTHKADLRKAPTTLTEAGSLRALDTPLWHVDEAITTVDLPAADRLHSDLVRSKVLAGLCRPYTPSKWVMTAAARMAQGDVREPEREALNKYLTGEPQLSAKAWAALRKVPVLRDHRGEWAAPARLTRRTTRNAEILEPALQFPTPGDEANKNLARLRFRTSLDGTDLLELARLVEKGEVAPAMMRSAVQHARDLLKRTVVARLGDIAFLETSTGQLAAPSAAYEPNTLTREVLGEAAPYASGLPAALLKRLGCRSTPSAEDILARIGELRSLGAAPPRPDRFYRALCDALRAERRSAAEHRAEPILWTGTDWTAPEDCLVGVEHRRTFLDAVPVLDRDTAGSYLILGACRKPQPIHWRQLFTWVDAANPTGRRVPTKVVTALTRAYAQLDTPPEGLPGGTRCLLDDQRQLHTLDDATRGRFLLNDDPPLADAIRATGAPVWFADSAEPRSRAFFRAAGSRALTEAAKYTERILGDEVEPSEALHAPRVVHILHNPMFAAALVTVAAKLCGTNTTSSKLARQLRGVRRIVFADKIMHRYRLAGTTVEVQRDFAVLPDRILLSPVRAREALRRSAADAIATLVEPTGCGGQHLSDPIFFLLGCRTAQHMAKELRRRGIAWTPDSEPTTDAGEDIEDPGDEEQEPILEELVRSVFAGRPPSTTTGRRQQAEPGARRPPRGPLANLDTVHERLASSGNWSAVTRAGLTGGAMSVWSPRSPQEQQDDAALGRQGEQIVLRRERRRVAAQGLDPKRVVWTADLDPAADHDIKSVDADGQDLWIEVKSTAGRGGKFTWAGAEFHRAVASRDRYVLVRVYEAHTTTPIVTEIRDPVGRVASGGLRLDLDSLTGDVGPPLT